MKKPSLDTTEELIITGFALAIVLIILSIVIACLPEV